MEELVDAYLAWKNRTESSPPFPVPEKPDEGYALVLYDIFTIEWSVSITRPDTSTSPAIDFMAYGILTKTPVMLTVGVAIRTLELLHHIRQRKPSVSMETFARIIADYYMVGMFHLSCTCILTNLLHRSLTVAIFAQSSWTHTRFSF